MSLINFTIYMGTVDKKKPLFCISHGSFFLLVQNCGHKPLFFLVLLFSQVDESRIPMQCHILHSHHYMRRFGFSFFQSLKSLAPTCSILLTFKPKTHITSITEANLNLSPIILASLLLPTGSITPSSQSSNIPTHNPRFILVYTGMTSYFFLISLSKSHFHLFLQTESFSTSWVK